MNVSDRHVIVTGAGAGIGLGIALNSDGANRLTGLGAEFVQLDATDLDGFDAAIAAAHER